MRRVTKTPHPLIEKANGHSKTLFATADHINLAYSKFARQLPFPTTRDQANWKTWRRKLTTALRKTLQLKTFGPPPTPSFKILSETNCGPYLRQKITYETSPGNRVPAYLLKPHTSNLDTPFPAAICPHGHGMDGKNGVVGISEPRGIAYGHELAKRGVVVLAPDNAGMGERDILATKNQAQNTGCFLVWARLNQMGLDLTGLRIFDLIAGVNILTNLPYVDPHRIGCAGLSGGCWLSQLLTALDTRIQAVVLSGFFTTFVQTTWHGHCVCHHPFGIGTICDMPDISALIAPRPQFVESGISDKPYPHQPAYTMVQQAYNLVDASHNLGLHRYRGGHMFNGKKSIPWLVKQLQ